MNADTPPLQPGWLVAYRDRDHRLVGGADDRLNGTVKVCEWVAVHRSFEVILMSGQRLALRSIRSVGQPNAAGQIISAWTTEDHGYDGEGRP